MYSSHFRIINDQISPDIRLPKDYLSLVPKFYSQKRKEGVETFASHLEQIMAQQSEFGTAPEIRLIWDDSLGLKHIKIGIQGGLDILEQYPDQYTPHNLGGWNGVCAGMIAMNYLRKLIQSGE